MTARKTREATGSPRGIRRLGGSWWRSSGLHSPYPADRVSSALSRSGSTRSPTANSTVTTPVATSRATTTLPATAPIMPPRAGCGAVAA